MIIQACIVAACTSFISKSQTVQPKRYQVVQCSKVMREAERQGVDQHIAVAVAWKESRFNPRARSKVGAVGVMQIIPRYWCPNKRRCDSVVYGIRALKKLKKTYGQRDYLCRYASGKSCALKPARRYKQSVKRFSRRMGAILNAHCVDGC